MPRLLFIRLLLCGMTAVARAQSPEPPSAEARLRDYEATYESGLRKIQTPLLSDYALKLQQLAAAAPVSDQPAIQAEIDRVQKIITSGGIVDLRSASSTQSNGQRPGAGAGAAMRSLPGAALVLRPDTASGPAVLGSAITIGKAAWTIDQLEAGMYEISVICAYPAFAGSASITASIAGQEATEELSTAKAAVMPDQFRFLRLGKVQFDQDVKNADLIVALKATQLTGVQIRQVIISKARPPGK